MGLKRSTRRNTKEYEDIPSALKELVVPFAPGVGYIPHSGFSLAFRSCPRLSQRQDKIYDWFLLFIIWDDISYKTRPHIALAL